MRESGAVRNAKTGRVVHQHRYALQRFAARVEKGRKRLFVRHVAHPGVNLDAQRIEFIGRRRQGFLAAGADRQVCALSCKLERDRAPDSLAGWSDGEVEGFAYGNWLRLLERALPAQETSALRGA